MHQVSLHSSEQRELLESMDLAGVLERGTQIASDFGQFGSADCFKAASNLPGSFLSDVVEATNGTAASGQFRGALVQRGCICASCVGQKLITFAMALWNLGRPCRTTLLGSTV